MAGEIACDTQTGLTLYANLRNRTSGYVWNGSTMEAYNAASGNQSSYALLMSEQGAGGHYTAAAPSALPAGSYDATVKRRINAFYAESDSLVANGQLEWDTSVAVPLSNLATSGVLAQLAPLRIARGTQILNFPIYFRSSSDHITAFTSGTVSGQVSRDGGSFGALQSGAFVETGLGYYRTTLTSGDLAGNTISLVFNAVGISGGSADVVPIAFVTQRVSGQN